MGNASSVPPPLVAVNTSSADILVPRGTELSSGSPLLMKGWYPLHSHLPHSHPLHSHPPHSHPLHSHPLHSHPLHPHPLQSHPLHSQPLHSHPLPSHPLHSRPHTKRKTDRHRRGAAAPVYSRVPIPARHNSHRLGLTKQEIQSLDDGETSESTQLGEVRARREEKAKKGVRKSGVKTGTSPFERDGHCGSGLVGYEGVRGGLGYVGVQTAHEVEDEGAVLGPGQDHEIVHPVVPLSPVLPHYASRESMPILYSNPYACASHPSRPPVSTSSILPSPDATSEQLPPAVQAAIHEAVQRSAGQASRLSNPLARLKTSPATFRDNKNSDWGEGINTCICTNNCKCRKGEGATKWYEGTAKIGDEVVPVRAKLNTRYVLKGDIGKDCGDDTACRRSASLESNSSDTGILKSRNHRKDRKQSRKNDKVEKLEARISGMMNAAASKQKTLYRPSPLPGSGPSFDTSDMDTLDPGMMQRLRMLDMSGTPYHTARMGGMNAAGPQQGMSDSMTTRNRQRPRMPPKPGMRMRYGDDGFLTKYEDIGPASLGNLDARPSGMRRKGWNKASKGRARFGRLGDGLVDSDSDSSAPDCCRPDMSRRQARSGKSRPYFELNDTDASLTPRSRAGMKGFGNDEDSAPTMDNLPKRGGGGGDRELGSSPPNGLFRVSPPGKRGGVHSRRTAGKQAHVETDDEEDY